MLFILYFGFALTVHSGFHCVCGFGQRAISFRLPSALFLISSLTWVDSIPRNHIEVNRSPDRNWAVKRGLETIPEATVTITLTFLYRTYYLSEMTVGQATLGKICDRAKELANLPRESLGVNPSLSKEMVHIKVVVDGIKTLPWKDEMVPFILLVEGIGKEEIENGCARGRCSGVLGTDQ
ncbi:hypothetical protein BT96DRAFT_944670 [Gymnopus androsaceus JB14]|uniref:Uncharacterized protein n=1 Tax=Gymnopus androsaceus JB14 TaxID=1447944 RepID=A0A6A4H2J2_9AGAR|nr:hypothetical protein BT96DRAFT_944670 [Gymnopus androsaceus JB14]